MDDKQIGQVSRELHLIAGMAYFMPEFEQELTTAGLEPGVMCYLG